MNVRVFHVKLVREILTAQFKAGRESDSIYSQRDSNCSSCPATSQDMSPNSIFSSESPRNKETKRERERERE